MKRLTKKTTIIIILAIVLSVSLTVAGVMTYAAFTDSQHAQRTIANYDTNGDNFRSNALIKVNRPEDNIVKIPTTNSNPNDDDPPPAENPAIMRVSVSNYEKVTAPYVNAINYTLTAKLVGSSYIQVNTSDVEDLESADEALYWVAIAKGNENPRILGSSAGAAEARDKYSSAVYSTENNANINFPFSSTLTGGEPDSDVFTVTMSEDFARNNPNLFLCMEAVPTDNTLPTLRGLFKAEYQAEGAKNSWTGTFSDDTATAPSDYDGFNYRISGVGRGTVTLEWDSNKVTLSYMSIKMLEAEGATFDGNSLTMDVDSDVTSVYDLQFYKANGSSWTSVVWNSASERTAMNGEVVTFGFVAES